MYDDAFTPLEPLDELGPSSPLPIDIEHTLAQLQAVDATLRMQSARIFCDVEDPRAIAPLVQLLQDPCPLVRVSAAYALGRNSSPDIVDTLISTLEQDWNGYVRKGIVWALGNARDSRSIPALMAAVQGDITAVRLWSASALGQLASLAPAAEITTEIAQTLNRVILTDPVAAVRSNGAWALGQMAELLRSRPEVAEQTGQSLLKIARHDPDLGVRDDARIALQKIATPEHLRDLEDLDGI